MLSIAGVHNPVTALTASVASPTFLLHLTLVDPRIQAISISTAAVGDPEISSTLLKESPTTVIKVLTGGLFSSPTQIVQ